METTHEFKPSAVINKGWISTKFQNAEKEMMAAALLTFIQKEDEWDTPISVEEFFEALPTMDIGPFTGMFHTLLKIQRKSLINALLLFEQDGYVEISDDRNVIRLTEEMIEFYSHYLG